MRSAALALLALGLLAAAVRAEVIEDPAARDLVQCVVEHGGSMVRGGIGAGGRHLAFAKDNSACRAAGSPCHDSRGRSRRRNCAAPLRSWHSRSPQLPPPPPLPPQPHAVVGRTCPTCPRGVFATKDLKNGDIIMKIPMKLAVPLR